MKTIKYILCAALLLISLNSFAEWVRASNGFIPRNAWAVGREEYGAPLYLCRANFHGGVHPGKIRRDFRGCTISYAGREITVPNYSVYIDRIPPARELHRVIVREMEE
jgi:Protein of unknown function (DUF3421)